jgi:predicted HTH transcriptional regulator
MTIQDVRSLAYRGEGKFIEFKRKVEYPEKIIREMVAFANTKGGHLLIGIDDDGTMPGLKYAEEGIYALELALEKWCRPKIEYEGEGVPVSRKKSVISFHIKESKKKPHYVLTGYIVEEGAAISGQKSKIYPSDKNGTVHSRKKRAYVRVEDKSLQASREVWEILKRNRKPKDIKFSYGEKEKILMKFLGEHETITLNEFKKVARLSYFRASRTLILLVLANVLEIIPQEKEDIFRLRPD